MSQLITTINQYFDINKIIGEQEALTQFYENYILKYTNSKVKRFTIGASVALFVLGYGIRKLLVPSSKALRNLPRVNFFKFTYYAVFKNYTSKQFYTIVSKKEVEESNGLYVKLERTGWVVHVANPEAAKQVFLKADLFPKLDFRTLPSEEKSYLNQFLGFDNILTTNGAEWKKHRMLTNPAFKVALPARLFGETAQQLFNIWDMKYKNEPFEVDFHNMSERLTLDIIGKAGFGFDFNAVEDENSKWRVIYGILNRAVNDPLHAFFPFLETKFLFLFPKRQDEFNKLSEWKAMLESVIENKRKAIQNNIDQGEEADRDLLTLMIESEFRGEGVLTNKELIGNLTVFFIGKHDTTAFALSSALYYMAIHPEIQEKARQEAINVLCPNGEPNEDIFPTIEDTKKFDYINQVMKETLRINNSVNFLVNPRIATKDTDLNGIFIPKDTQVNINIYDLHHNANVWNNPFEFNPDRFAPGGEAETKSGLAYVPFANGNRQCLGMNFSLLEQRVILACILRKYEFSLPENSIHKDEMICMYDFISRPVDLKFRFKRRY
ncbi:unnamed protein product [Cunninghamella blakesleeana]